jgi:hypothetical protein
MTPIATPAMTGEATLLQLFSPDLSRVAFEAYQSRGKSGPFSEPGAGALLVGSVGGPYATVASIPAAEVPRGETSFAGANAGVPGGVPPFSAVVLRSPQRALLPPGREREAAEQTRRGRQNLYELADGRVQLVNVDSDGRSLNPCGAELGHSSILSGDAVNAVSADGSRVFFTSPQGPGLPGCLEPALYMRVGGATVDASEPEGVSVAPSARGDVLYDGASADGSKVFFTTATALMPSVDSRPGFKLYEYDTEAPPADRLTLIGNEVAGVETERINPGVVISEDGSTVYYAGVCDIVTHGQSVPVSGICRYETATGKTRFVAVPRETPAANEPSYVTPDGNYLLFASGSASSPLPVEFQGPNGLEPELRCAGPHEELYRYDAVDGSVTCVSRGEGVGVAPKGILIEPESFTSTFGFADEQAGALSISDDGRRVFFQTTAKLLPQDTNLNSAEEEREGKLGVGTDVYEWEVDGTEEAPGVFCETMVGCTHLISAGEAVGPERFLGASASGDNVFFTSAAQLLPQATPEFTNVYDARVNGGFPPPPPNVECASCQGVGSSAPQFGSPASGTLAGAGNPLASTHPHVRTVTKPKRCRPGYTHSRRGKCVRVKARRKRRP